MQGTTFLSFSSISFGISFEHTVQLPFTVFLYCPFPDNYAFLSLSPSQIKNIQSADTVPVHGHSPLVKKKFVLPKMAAILNFRIFAQKLQNTEMLIVRKPCYIERFRRNFWSSGYLCRAAIPKSFHLVKFQTRS